MAPAKAARGSASLPGGHLVSIRDLSRPAIDGLLDDAAVHAKRLAGRERQGLAEGRVLATLFYEPSTRTRLSFESAMLRLGGSTLSMPDAKTSSATKGESLSDTIRIVSGYADAVVLRHPREGSARLAARFSDVPIINAGDGAGEHPTQTLTDLYTIRESTGNLDGVRVVLSGDLRYGRTVHSLALALASYKAELKLVPAGDLELPAQLVEEAEARGASVERFDRLKEAVGKADVLYQTRLQRERLTGPAATAPERVTLDTLRDAPRSLKVLHPLPRVDEVASEVDATEHAAYFQQARNGIPVRMAVLAAVLEASP